MKSHMEHEALYRGAIIKYGEELQLNCVNEEAAEMIVVLNHLRRGRANLGKLLEEIGDLHVMLAQALIIMADRNDVYVSEIYNLQERYIELSRGKLRKKLGQE